MNYPIKEYIKQFNNNIKDTTINEGLEYLNNEILLKNFNTKYKLNIKDTKINKLDLIWCKLGNEGLKD